MITYRRGETPKLWAVFETKTLQQDGTWTSGTLSDPGISAKVIIEDSTGTVAQALADMTRHEVGIYYYTGYSIPADANTGIWNWEARGTSADGFVSSYYGSFEVKKQVA